MGIWTSHFLCDWAIKSISSVYYLYCSHSIDADPNDNGETEMEWWYQNCTCRETENAPKERSARWLFMSLSYYNEKLLQSRALKKFSFYVIIYIYAI